MKTHDPFARVEQRRLEMIQESTDKERALIKRIVDTRQKALNLRGDADKLARNHHLQNANDTKAAAELLEDEARRLENVDLRQHRIEAANIRMNQHPELSSLLRVAELRSRSAQEDQKRAACNALTAAKSALYEHLAKLATPETLRLATAVVDAETAANVEASEAAQTLLALLGPKAAA
jgi:hypothetical protein